MFLVPPSDRSVGIGPSATLTPGAALSPPSSARPTPAAEREFLEAIHDYKRTSGRMFPTWCEVLEVLEGLGYRKADR
jgi:hypothetical protein